MKDILSLVAKRLGLGLVTLFVVSLVIFTAVQMLPGDFAEERLGQGATDEAVAAIRAELGLDQPAHIRYFQWLGNAIQGDFGTSFGNERPVAEQLQGRFANTLYLALYAAAIAIPVSLTIGVLAALYRKFDLRPAGEHRHADLDLVAGILRRLYSGTVLLGVEPDLPIECNSSGRR